MRRDPGIAIAFVILTLAAVGAIWLLSSSWLVHGSAYPEPSMGFESAREERGPREDERATVPPPMSDPMHAVGGYCGPTGSIRLAKGGQMPHAALTRPHELIQHCECG